MVERSGIIREKQGNLGSEKRKTSEKSEYKDVWSNSRCIAKKLLTHRRSWIFLACIFALTEQDAVGSREYPQRGSCSEYLWGMRGPKLGETDGNVDCHCEQQKPEDAVNHEPSGQARPPFAVAIAHAPAHQPNMQGPGY